MAECGGIYKCEVCGNIVEVLVAGEGELTCCGQAMTYLDPIEDGDKAPKHKPVVSIDGNTVTVCVGEVTHPSEEEHFIEFIEVYDGKNLYHKDLAAGDEPKAVFEVENTDDLIVRSLCNLHGLWKA